MSRRTYVEQLLRMTSDNLVIPDPDSGWPALGTIANGEDPVPVAIYAGRLGLSHRSRDHVERRYQNPGQGKPISPPDGTLPLLLGLWREGDGPDVLVGMVVRPRLGLTTRFSMFVPLAAYEPAVRTGWVEHTSTSGELIVVFAPELLPAYASLRQLQMANDSGR